MELTHIDEKGHVRMVDVGEKAISAREAKAQAIVKMNPETLMLICEGKMPKGDVFSCARIAGIMASKKTHELIPMCHNLPIDSVELDIKPMGKDRVYITAVARCHYKTGIEMEALTAATVAALTIYDMCKAVDKKMEISEIFLLEKTGGKSGHFLRNND